MSRLGPGEMIPPVLLLGHGRMGSALATGWRERGLQPSFAVDPNTGASEALELDIVPEIDEVPSSFEPAAVVLAVKPQVAAEGLPGVARFARRAVVLSIMAGRTIASLRAAVGLRASIVRAMPNVAAAIRQGVTVACAGPGVSREQRALCDTLLQAVGEVAWVEDEALLDPVTAVSGSGPAYVFLLAELLERAAIAEGIAPDLARMLARGSVSGAGSLLMTSSEEAAELRRSVTSGGGVTEAALEILMAQDAWPMLVRRAIAAGTARSRDLAR